MAFTVSVFTGCDDDEAPVNLDAPTVTAPAATAVQTDASISLSFNYTAAAGFKGSSITNQTGGTATITTDGVAGATSGTITVEFTAGSTAGAGSVTLQITDNEDDTGNATAVLTVSTTTPPTITGIPATAEIAAGSTLSVPDVTLAAEAGLKSLAVSVNGADVAALGQDLTSAGTSTTLTFEAPQTVDFAPGTYTIVFTLTDAEDVATTFTHTLTVTATPVVLIEGNIEADANWTKDNIYEIAGRVFVTNGATLTIEAGTIVKGRTGTGTNASVLTIARGSKIMANGTASEPIIFTSVEDNIQAGQLKGSNRTADDNQLWGGLVILGNAPISPDAGTEAQIEGVPASETLGLYGGAVEDDNSGVLNYISIRHGGTTIDPSAGNDINGLTLGGVGSGTSITNIEIIANFDDGVEFFGGTVDVTNLLVYGVGDDAIDVDQAWKGTVDNFWVFTTAGAGSDEGLEIDGPEGAANSEGKFTIQNGLITAVGGGSAADFKSAAQGTVNNVKWSGFDPSAVIKIRASYENDCADAKTDAFTNLANDDLVFTTVEFTEVSVYTGSKAADGTTSCTVPGADQTTAEGKVTSSTATGAGDASIWNNWSLAAGLGLL
ncbi:MAG: hypothetical protein ACPGJS_13815 [Flammeovirgaceae bacterium]